MSTTETGSWPSIALDDWLDTRDTLHLYTQVVGKVRLANEPLINHWWNSTLYVSARGLTTSLMPHPTGPAFQIDFDFLDHRLDITTIAGTRRLARRSSRRPVADFYAAVMAMLDDSDVATAIWPVPVEIPGAIPFTEDRVHASYDATRCAASGSRWSQMERVFKVFRARFVGKASPVHLFWGALDLALTPASRDAPRRRIRAARPTAGRT